MQIVADLHLHSKYSRAVSPQMVLPVMASVAKQKGLDLLTAADWTHPVWFKEIRQLLQESADGIYSLKDDTGENPTRYLLSTEIACIYKQGEKLRRIHNLIFVPNLETAEKVSKALLAQGANLSSDGRPIIGLSAKALLELILTVDETCFLIPCHIWTPHFGIYGSASGFDSLAEAFGELAPQIYGIETGLSSDPEMNWQIPELENRAILSFSDAHSPAKMGREATVFVSKNGMSNDKLQISNLKYEDVRQVIMRKNTNLRIGYTIEFYPEEGKYHFSGHRNCKVSYGPEDIAQNGTTCPVCHRRLTEGVMRRVQTLAGNEYHPRAVTKRNDSGLLWFTDTEKKHPPYLRLVPLLEIVAESMGATVLSQKVRNQFEQLCVHFGSELEVLLKAPVAQLKLFGGERLGEAIQKVREGNIQIVPGYDGEYGKVSIWPEGTKQVKGEQTQLL